jgi:hypothetical protein
MKIPSRTMLVAVARTPFVANAAAARGERLVARLAATEGIKSEMMTLPTLARDGERMVDEAILCGLLRTGNADHMIALNFPAYIMPYPSLTVWIGAVEDLPAAARAVAAPVGGRATEIAEALACADARAFERAERLFCASAELADLVGRWCGARAELLPVPDGSDAEGWARVVARIAA